MSKKLLLMAMLATAFVACTKNDDDNVVDLGLPSGVKWAKMNVGATNPWDYGDYFAWGETVAKSTYDASTYKYYNGDCNKITKYCNNADSGYDGFTDALITLESADDVASAWFGSDYSIPTADEWKELCGQCYWVWTSKYNGQDVSGYIVYKTKSDADKGVTINAEGTPSDSYSLSDVHIFLPFADSRSYSNLPQVGLSGKYWSSSLNEKSPNNARYCYFDSGSVRPSPSWYHDRCNGHSVRAIKRP